MGQADGDERWMREALAQAHDAAVRGEVPVGAVVVQGGKILGAGYNRKETGDPTAHAEVVAIRAAAAARGDWRLDGATLYVTLEPCLMCAGAIVQARVARVVYGAADPKFGAVASNLQAFAPGWNHRPHVTAGVLAAESADLLQRFFRARRAGIDPATATT